MLPPGKAEPGDIALDRLFVLDLFLGRIGVIETEMAAAGKVAGQAEVQTDRLGMADVQVAVRLRREAGDDAAMPPLFEVGTDNIADKVARRTFGDLIIHGRDILRE